MKKISVEEQRVDRWFTSLEARIEELKKGITEDVYFLDLINELSVILNELRQDPNIGDLNNLECEIAKYERLVRLPINLH